MIEIPGATKESLEIGPGPVAGTVSVKAQCREDTSRGSPLHAERGARTGTVRFERVVPVAWDADVAKARPEIRDGVLTLVVPRRSPEPKKEPTR